MKKLNCALLGTGNIGTDLLYKIMQSDLMRCEAFIGRNPKSIGIQIATEMGIKTSTRSINEILARPKDFDIVFDATSATSHKTNAIILNDLNILTIDLTPAKVGKMCVPAINIESCLNEKNINFTTCGGQATIPVAYAIAQIHPDVKYFEIVSTIASKSAGIGTRDSIDEFTQTTSDAIVYFTGVQRAKAIIVLNPAEPPVQMKATIYALIDNPNIGVIQNKVMEMEQKIKTYVPGYKIILGPIYESGKIIITIEVKGKGDFLPEYSGNLDIITCAAIEFAEKYAIKKLEKVV